MLCSIVKFDRFNLFGFWKTMRVGWLTAAAAWMLGIRSSHSNARKGARDASIEFRICVLLGNFTSKVNFVLILGFSMTKEPFFLLTWVAVAVDGPLFMENPFYWRFIFIVIHAFHEVLFCCVRHFKIRWNRTFNSELSWIYSDFDRYWLASFLSPNEKPKELFQRFDRWWKLMEESFAMTRRKLSFRRRMHFDFVHNVIFIRLDSVICSYIRRACSRTSRVCCDVHIGISSRQFLLRFFRI